MPPLYVAAHLLLTACCVRLALWLKPRSRAAWVGGLLGLAVVVTGFVVERRSELAWGAMALSWPDAVFFTNLSVEGVAVLVALLWRGAADRPARARAIFLGAAAVAVALWSVRWLFAPAPAHLGGTVDRNGLCRQTSEQSCGAAAAATLLHHAGIETTEAEMGRLCLTREGFGTAPLGILRGVTLKAGSRGLRARYARLRPEGDLHRLPTPCIVSIGLNPGAPPEVAGEMEGYGWTPGLHHAVVFLDADPGAGTIRVADPSYGVETWPTKGLRWIWDGQALYLQ